MYKQNIVVPNFYVLCSGAFSYSSVGTYVVVVISP
jgi:hypothetical protein